MLTKLFTLCFFALTSSLCATTLVKVIDPVPCDGATPLTDSSGVDLYCGRGGQRCPLGSFCDIHPSDRYAKCCRNKDERVPCDGEKPLTDYTGKELYCGRGGVRCPYGSYCDIHPSDKFATCCPVKEKPGKCPQINCFVSDCSKDSGCPGTQKCCNGCCAEPLYQTTS